MNNVVLHAEKFAQRVEIKLNDLIIKTGRRKLMEVMDVYCLDCANDFMGPYICSSLSNCIYVLNMCSFGYINDNSIKLLPKKKKKTKKKMHMPIGQR